MRSFVMVLALMVLVPLFVLAQAGKQQIVYLKNGYSVKGVIIEQNEQVVKVRIKDGQIFEYPQNEVDRISSSEEKVGKSSDDSQEGMSRKPALADNTIFVAGDQLVSAGLALGGGFSYTRSFSTSGIPGLFASYEQGIIDDLFDDRSTLGAGGYVGFMTEGNSSYNYRYTYALLGLRGTIHYQFVEKLDTYGGLLAGLEYTGHKPSSKSGLGLTLFLGGRYFFTDKYGAFLELGMGRPGYVNIGVTLRL